MSLNYWKERYKRGSLYLRSHSGNIHCSYSIDGVSFRESTGTKNKGKAKKYLDKRLEGVIQSDKISKIRFEYYNSNSARITIFDIMEELRKQRSTKTGNSIIDRIQISIGGLKAISLGTPFIVDYVKSLKCAGYSNSTVNQTLDMLEQGYKLAIRQGNLSVLPLFDRLKLDNVRNYLISKDQVDLIVQYAPDYLKDYILFGFITAWKKSKISSLTWDYKIDKLSTEAKEIISKRKSVKSGLYIFHNNGRKIGDFRKVWAKVVKKVGCPNTKFSDIRPSSLKCKISEAPNESWKILTDLGYKTNSSLRRYKLIED